MEKNINIFKILDNIPYIYRTPYTIFNVIKVKQYNFYTDVCGRKCIKFKHLGKECDAIISTLYTEELLEVIQKMQPLFVLDLRKVLHIHNEEIVSAPVYMVDRVNLLKR